MNLKDLENKNQDKALIFIQSRLHKDDISAPLLKEQDGFNIIDLPLLYLGEPSKNEFKEWSKIDTPTEEV